MKSEDFGDSWEHIDDGLPDSNVTSIQICGDYLYLTSDHSGIWRRPLSEITGFNHKTPVQPGQFSLSQNYPNPFNPTTEIEFFLPVRTAVTLTLYNILGEVGAILIDVKMFDPGFHSCQFNGSRFASGVYSIRLTSTGENRSSREIKKMVLLR